MDTAWWKAIHLLLCGTWTSPLPQPAAFNLATKSVSLPLSIYYLLLYGLNSNIYSLEDQSRIGLYLQTYGLLLQEKEPSQNISSN